MKREKGQYFTERNPFKNDGFKEWAEKCDLKNQNILEPFAGSNNLINMLIDMKLCNSYKSYDIEPKNENVIERDTLKDFPTGHKVCITNPPYLAQNSAKRRGLNYPDTEYDDLYKYALSKCLENCEYVGAIIPASFLNSKLFRDRLSCYILLNSIMFTDTEHPVCLALFEKEANDVDVYDDEEYIGKLSSKEFFIEEVDYDIDIKFNDPYGEIGLIAIDNTKEASIKFIKGEEIESNKISNSSRSITRISLSKKYNTNKLINLLNNNLQLVRYLTSDIFFTPFKGLRKDGKYRRRLDYNNARIMIKRVLKEKEEELLI